MLALSLLLLTSFSLHAAQQTAGTPKAPARQEAESARDALLGVFKSLKKTHHHTPYVAALDFDTGAMSMDNEGARWEFKLGELDPGTISARTWNPGGGDRESRTIGADCSGGRNCVKWGTSNGLGGYKTTPPPSFQSSMQFEVYRGQDADYGRDPDAEKVAVHALRTLIAYFRQKR
jgi:hypothetical protein